MVFIIKAAFIYEVNLSLFRTEYFYRLFIVQNRM